MNRPLTAPETELVRWMLERGKPEAAAYLSQLDEAMVTPWRCACGCASMHFAIAERPKAQGGMNVLADFVDRSASSFGIFVYAQEGVLSGLEVYGLAGEAPKALPSIESLRVWENAKADERRHVQAG